MAESLTDDVSRDEVRHVLKQVRTREAFRCMMEFTAISRDAEAEVMTELSQGVLDGLGMLAKWALHDVGPVVKWKGDVISCSCHRAVALLEHGKKVVESRVQNSDWQKIQFEIHVKH